MRDRENYGGRRHFRKKLIFAPFVIAAILALVSFVVMQLWNHLLPDILHVGVITFWQALGIFVLCKILFGFGKGGGRFGGGAPWMIRRKMEEKFKHMSPEQRERFREKFGDRACRWREWSTETEHPFDKKWDDEAPKTEPATE